MRFQRSILLKFAVLIVLILFDSGFTQAPPALTLNVDVAEFVAEAPHSKIEIYQGIGRHGLRYQQGNEALVASFAVETVVLDADSAVVFRHEVNETDRVRDRAEIKPGQQFMYVHPILLTPGRFVLITELTDENSGRTARRKIPLDVTSFSADSLTLSDIQMATSIKKAKGGNSIFDKNNLRITPNPQCLFGDGHENLTFYAELYNLHYSKGVPGAYHVDYIIENESGESLHRLPGKQRRKTGNSAAIYAFFDISSLASGRYRLRLEAHDDDSALKTSAVKAFTVYREAELTDRMRQDEGIYDNLNESELQTYFNKISFIATSDEKKLFPQLELEGKRQFLVDFWRRRDPSPGTPDNEFKNSYIQRLIEAQASFTVSRTQGWKSDRGRILLTYGSPNDIERVPASPDKNAYEVWSYNELDGGALFYFIDVIGNSDYELIHSTYRNEVNNPDWRTYLYR